MADDLSHYGVSVYGSTSYKTPNLDRLASTGMLFKECYALPLCTPSRVAIMTGMHNGRNYVGGHMLDLSQVTFGELFREAGYKTGFAGKWKLTAERKKPDAFGFDRFCLSTLASQTPRYRNPVLHRGHVRRSRYTNGEYGPDLVSDFALDFIEKHRSERFFLYYPMILVHEPHTPTPDSPDYAENKDDPENFPAMVGYADKLVGRLVDKLEELGLRENTLILFTGDGGNKKVHSITLTDGSKYGGGKGLMSDEGVHVPLIANQRGVVPAGVSHDLIEITDILPTICDAASITIPRSIPIDGVSFLPQLRGEENPRARRWIYQWFSNAATAEDLRESAFTQDYRLYRRGGFYNVKADFQETHPLSVAELDDNVRNVHDMLSRVLEDHAFVKAERLVADATPIDLEVGERRELDVRIEPTNTTQSTLRWQSDDEAIARVNKWGVVTGVDEGTAKLRVSSFDKSTTLTIEVRVDR